MIHSTALQNAAYQLGDMANMIAPNERAVARERALRWAVIVVALIGVAAIVF